MRATMTSVIAAGLALGGCAIGRADPKRAEALRSPYGQTVELLLSRGPDADPVPLSGELLWVERDAVAVLAEDTASPPAQRAVRVPMEAILRHRVVLDARTHATWGTPTPDDFFGAARYRGPPDASQLKALLDALGVEELERYPGGDSGDPGAPREAGGSHDAGGSHGFADAPVDAPPATLHAFLEEARATAARFATLDAAIAEGYRRLGPAFPGMGEHWVHPGRIVAGRIDARHPAVLCFVRVDGEARLTSLAFTLPLGADAEPPAEPFGRAAWHDHADRVDEESLLLAHPASHHGADGPRLAMVHVWVWPENPDGVLAQNNWRLPFAVAGLPVASLDPPADAARGLSLWTAGPDYYERLFRAAADPSARELEALRSALEEHRDRAGRWIEESLRDGAIDGAELDAIASVWSSLWDRLETGVAPATWERLAPLR